MTGISRSVRINAIGMESIVAIPSFPFLAVRMRQSFNCVPITVANASSRSLLSSMIRILFMVVLSRRVLPIILSERMPHDLFELIFVDRFVNILECAEAYRLQVG